MQIDEMNKKKTFWPLEMACEFDGNFQLRRMHRLQARRYILVSYNAFQYTTCICHSLLRSKEVQIHPSQINLEKSTILSNEIRLKRRRWQWCLQRIFIASVCRFHLDVIIECIWSFYDSCKHFKWNKSLRVAARRHRSFRSIWIKQTDRLESIRNNDRRKKLVSIPCLMSKHIRNTTPIDVHGDRLKSCVYASNDFISLHFFLRLLFYCYRPMIFNFHALLFVLRKTRYKK